MKRWTQAVILCGAGFLGGVIQPARADIIVRGDGALLDGKVTATDEKQITYLPDGADASQTQQLDRSFVTRIVRTDEHGARMGDGATTREARDWNVPPEPTAPPIAPSASGKPTYYLIPLHGEVGTTILAGALEKSLADALARRPTVVVLDIDSPGGLVEEAEKIIKVLHRYNKKIRIVALADKDLSAAAIFSLSVKEIYVKSSSTIGAATSFVPGNLKLPEKIEEKMQSAWRAVARNSAEEGGHEPLLAEAMIDNDMELHLETVNGKPVVKEGSGEKMLTRKGKILTLSSHEAEHCGLAAGDADDLDELADDLKLTGWTECKGLGTLMAEYLPKRAQAFESHSTQIMARFEQDFEKAKASAPGDEVSRTIVRGPASPGRIPGRPGVYMIPGTTNVITRVSHGNWKAKSLQCVLDLQDAEADLDEEASLCEAFGQQGLAEFIRRGQTHIGVLRAGIYDDRNKFGRGGPVVAGASGVPQVPGVALPPGTSGTPIVGGPGGGMFTNVSPGRGPVLGFRYTLGDWGGKAVLRRLDPVFEKPADDSNVLIGRDGYVVAGLMVEADNVNVTAAQVIFAKFRAGRIDISDTYKSDWMGNSTAQNARLLAGNGQMVIGTYGRRGMNLDAIGLVLNSTEHVANGPSRARGTAPTRVIRFLPAGASQTDFVGGTGGAPFVAASPTGAPVVGFYYMFGSWSGRTVLRRFDPIFNLSDARPVAGFRAVSAKEGYAVSGLTVETDGTNVTAVRITFSRFDKDHLVLDDSYKSDWIGLSTGEGTHELADGRIIVGACGRRGLNLDALGVVVVPAK